MTRVRFVTNLFSRLFLIAPTPTTDKQGPVPPPPPPVILIPKYKWVFVPSYYDATFGTLVMWVGALLFMTMIEIIMMRDKNRTCY